MQTRQVLLNFASLAFIQIESHLSRLQSQVQNRIAIDKETLEDKIAQIRGGVVAAYPDGLPEDDLVKIALDGVSLEVNFKSLSLQIFNFLVQLIANLSIHLEYKYCRRNIGPTGNIAMVGR